MNLMSRRVSCVTWITIIALLLLTACGSQPAATPGNNQQAPPAPQPATPAKPPEPAQLGNTTTNTPEPAKPSTPEPPKELLPLTVMELVPVTDPMVSFFTLAQELGVFKENGLDVEVKAAGGGAPLKIQALLANEADIATVDIIVSMSTIYEGGDFKVIMVPSARYGASIVANKKITDITQMKGQQWGVPSIGGSARFLTELVLEAKGMKQDDVKWLAVGGTGDALPRLFTGRVDIATLTPSALPLLKNEEAKDVHVLIENTAAVTKPFPNFNFIAKSEFLEKNPEKAYRFVKAMMEMSRIFIHEPERYKQVVNNLMPDKYTSDDLDALMNSLSSMGYWAENGGINYEGTQIVMDLFMQHQEKGPNERLNKPEQVYDVQFINRVLDEIGVANDSLDKPDWRK